MNKQSFVCMIWDTYVYVKCRNLCFFVTNNDTHGASAIVVV
jgi:hypothetical protein